MTPDSSDTMPPDLGPVPRPAPDMPAGLRIDVERAAVRTVLLDARGHVLLFHTHVPASDPPRWWDLPGGGLEPGETYVDAAVREIAEETGLVVPREAVGAPTWRRSATWHRKGVRRVQHEFVVPVRTGVLAPDPDRTRWTVEELEEYVGARWWSVDEIVEAGARGEIFYPGRLPQLLPRFLAGEFIDEPFEWWN